MTDWIAETPRPFLRRHLIPDMGMSIKKGRPGTGPPFFG